MRKEWLLIGVAAVALRLYRPDHGTAGATTAVQRPGGGNRWRRAQYEPYNPNNMQDYKVNGDTYRIVKDPQNFRRPARRPGMAKKPTVTPPRWASSSIRTA